MCNVIGYSVVGVAYKRRRTSNSSHRLSFGSSCSTRKSIWAWQRVYRFVHAVISSAATSARCVQFPIVTSSIDFFPSFSSSSATSASCVVVVVVVVNAWNRFINACAQPRLTRISVNATNIHAQFKYAHASLIEGFRLSLRLVGARWVLTAQRLLRSWFVEPLHIGILQNRTTRMLWR